MPNTVNIEQYIKPIETVEAFIEALQKVNEHNIAMAGNSGAMQAQVTQSRDTQTVNALKERGFPSKGEYSLERIIAHDSRDLEIKFYLALMPYINALIDNEDHDELEEAIYDLILPMTDACSSYLDSYHGPFPITITP